jgi:hypothetical protein
LKGQYIGMMTLFVFLFIVTGNIFGALLFQDEYSERVEFSVGGPNTIAEAQIRGKLYQDRMEKELNYSSNIIALQQVERERVWSSAPTHQQVLNSYLNAVAGELRLQSGLVKCNPPEIGSVSVEDNSSYTAAFSDPYISCSTTGTDSRIKLSEDQIGVENINNSFVQLSEVGVELGEHIDSQDLPENWDAGEGFDSARDRDSVSQSEKDRVDRNARQEAERRAIENSNLASDLADDFENLDWVEIETETEFEFRTLSTDPQDGSYKYTVCTGGSEEEECTPEVRTGDTYNNTIRVEVTDVRLKYDLADRKKINKYKDPREAVKNDEIGFEDFDLRVSDEERDEDEYRDPREVFDDWVEDEISTEEADDETRRSFDIPWDKIQRERKLLDSNAELQTLHFKFDYLHEIN